MPLGPENPKPRGILTNRDSVGAKVYVETLVDGQSKEQYREVRLGDGLNFNHPSHVHFGAGNGTVGTIRVEWPSGNSTEYFGQRIPLSGPVSLFEPLRLFPINSTVSLGGDVTLSVVETAARGETVTWFKDGVPLDHQEKTLILRDVTLEDEGVYSVEIREANGSRITKSKAYLEVDSTFETLEDLPFNNARSLGFWADIDRDSLVDYYIQGAGGFRNLGGGVFEPLPRLEADQFEGQAVTFSDLDNDGIPELILTPGLIENLDSGGASAPHQIEYTANRGWVGSSEPIFEVSTSVLFPTQIVTADYNRDGWLDYLAGSGQDLTPRFRLFFR